MTPHHLRLLSILATLLTFGLVYLPWCKQQVRHALQWGIRLLLRMTARLAKIEAHAIILIVAPHPDDESLGCGGLIASSRLKGIDVHVVFITDGQASHPMHPTLTPEVLAGLRRTEACNALQVLGLDSKCIYFLGEADGTLANVRNEQSRWSKQLAKVITRIQPTKVFLPCSADGSSEHEAVFAVSVSLVASCESKPQLFEYPVWAWRQPLRLLEAGLKEHQVERHFFPGLGHLKQSAIACHKSQTQPQTPWKNAILDSDFLRPFQTEEEYFFTSSK